MPVLNFAVEHPGVLLGVCAALVGSSILLWRYSADQHRHVCQVIPFPVRAT